ncbi:retroviral-like aspartic protease family protein [Brevundimonas sp. NPDC092305]|uniref:retroviral-like aspartic protease family protein n=1 Tax=Brevundimonas sp. NPDC092305 TaxID=3363957 RepID=UPI0037FC0F6C
MDRRPSALTRRIATAGLFGLATTGLTGGQEPAAPGPETAVPLPEEARLAANLLTRMSLDVELDRRRAGAFVLDTGAERTVVSTELATSLGLPAGPRVMVHGLTAARIAPTVRIGRAMIAGRTFTGLTAPVFPRADIAADGLIGLDVLSQFRIEVEMDRRRISMSVAAASTPFASSGSAGTRLTNQMIGARRDVSGQLILTSARANGTPVEAFVDSGAQYSIGNLALRTLLGGQWERLDQTVIKGVTGEIPVVARGRIADLRLGQHRLGGAEVLFADLHAFSTLGLADRPALLLGADILYRFRKITLDFGRGQMQFSGLRRAAPGAG